MQRMNKYSWWSNRLVAVARISLSTEIIESHRKWSYCAARVEPELLLSLQISCPPRSCWWACETGHVTCATAPPAAWHNNLRRQNSLDMGSVMSFKEVLLLVLTKALYFVYIWLPFFFFFGFPHFCNCLWVNGNYTCTIYLTWTAEIEPLQLWVQGKKKKSVFWM